jgi:hypothetical protein
MPRYENIYEYEPDLDGERPDGRHRHEPLQPGYLRRPACRLHRPNCKRLGVAERDIEIATVPGALEIPLDPANDGPEPTVSTRWSPWAP